MRIWIDADATPGDIKEIVLRASQRLRVETILVANKNVGIGEGELVSLVRVDAGPDVADAYIVEHGQAGDFAITADIPLAARLVEKGLTVIDPRGELYSAESIGERLAIRDFMRDLRASGVQTGGPAPFDRRAKQRFAALFDRLLTAALRGG
jgi:uncharacterized protein YaiI (UPF0178 family)